MVPGACISPQCTCIPVRTPLCNCFLHPRSQGAGLSSFVALHAPMAARQVKIRLRVVGLMMALVACSTCLLVVWRPMGACKRAPLSDLGAKLAIRNTDVPLGAMLMPLTSAGQSTLEIQCLDYRGPFEQIYRPMNYSACQAPLSVGHVQCWPLLAKDVDCEVLFTDYIYVLRHYQPLFPAPKQLQAAQRDSYLLQGFSQYTEFYISAAEWAPNAGVPNWTEAMFDPLVDAARARKQVGHYGNVCFHIYQALDCHPISGSSGAVFGTEAPWLEAILFAFGVEHVTTVEFRKTLSHILHHRVITPLDWALEWKAGTLAPVDFAFSFSSWEHDGLGRYGDPLDPWGDVKAFERTSCYLKPGGLLFFGAPMSYIDQLQYNAHRIYGFVRLPIVTANWEVLGVYEEGSAPGVCGMQTCQGVYERWKKKAQLGNYAFQPLVVLRNLRTTPCQPTAQVAA